jgi:tetratricopeptide (TPR) repeat protein
LSLARRALEERRRRTQEILAALQEADRRTRSPRSPQDLLEGVRGLDALFGKDLSADMADEQSRAYRDAILGNLGAALQKGLFVTRKDHLRAEGYLAYFQEDWPKALALWSQALALDPADPRLKEDVSSLQVVLARRESREKVLDLARQGRIHAKMGDHGQAMGAWKELLALEPDNAEAKVELAVARVALEKYRRRARLKEKTDEGLRLYKAGDAFSAAEVWLEVLQEDPLFEEARVWLQHAGRKIKSAGAVPPPPAAKEASAEAPVARDPDRAMELYKQGVVSYAQGDTAQAIETWRQVLRLDPSLNRAREALKQAQAELALQ